MRSKEIYDVVDGLAPFAFSRALVEKYGYRDNSGVILDCGEEISAVLCSLDLTAKAVEEAKRAGANCIMTHHPAIFGGIMRIGSSDPLLLAARAGISVISAHLNLDAAPCGIDESLMEGLGGKEASAFYEEADGAKYGRVYDVQRIAFGGFCEHAKAELCAKRVLCYGEGEVKRVASFCGAGLDEGGISFAAAHGADTVVSSDGKHHLLAEAVERGLKVMLLTHYAAENYGFRRFAARLKEKLAVPVSVFTDERFL